MAGAASAGAGVAAAGAEAALAEAQAAPDSPHAGVPHAEPQHAGASQAGSQHFGSQGSHFGFRQFSLGSFNFGSFSLGISSLGSLHLGVSQQELHLFPATLTSATVRTNATAITQIINFLNISDSKSTDTHASLRHPRPLIESTTSPVMRSRNLVTLLNFSDGQASFYAATGLTRFGKRYQSRKEALRFRRGSPGLEFVRNFIASKK